MSRPTVVVFTVADGGSRWSTLLPVFEAWHDRYQSFQLVLVDTRSSPDVITARAAETSVPLVRDTGAFQEAFDTNRTPIAYLLDADGVLHDKMIGFAFDRVLAFDEQLARADREDWEAVAVNAVRPVQVGQVAEPLTGMRFDGTGPSVVYISSPFCASCQEVPGGSFQQLISEYAVSRPEVRFYLYEPVLDDSTGLTLPVPMDTLSRYAENYGAAALSPVLQEFLATGVAPMEEPVFTLPVDGWAENVTVVRFEPSSGSDPNAVWGYAFFPALLVFSPDGTFMGPTPYWDGSGPYSLIGTIEHLLE
ncbi:MAG: hypothetical protein KF813_06250 [Trueperaceae bacterium]|nr:hypothetical protein [Trueperaceae bacterium]